VTTVYLDATTLIALGTVGELELLTSFDGQLVALPTVQAEVTTEPARMNLVRLLESTAVVSTPPVDIDDERAMGVLDECQRNGDVRIVGAVPTSPGRLEWSSVQSRRGSQKRRPWRSFVASTSTGFT